MKIREYIGLCAGFVISPTDASFYVKRNKNRFSYLFVCAVLILFAIADIMLIQFVNYPVSSVDLKSQNILLFVAVPVIAVVLWIFSAYAVSTILDGSAKFKELAVAGACSTVPFILTALPVVGISYLLEINQAGFFSVVQGAVILWIVLLLFYNFMNLNEYTLGKALATSLLTVLVMFAICFVFFIFYSMANQLIDFLKQLFLEIQLLAM